MHSPPLSLPDALLVRRPTLDDAEAVSDLYNICSMAELGVAVTTPNEIRGFWDLSGFDREHDAWIIGTGEEPMAGYIDVWSSAPYVHIYADGCVHPDQRGRGIGRSLLRLASARARELIERAPADMRVVLITRVNSANEWVKPLLREEGFVLIRSFWRMAIQLDREPARPTCPAGITIRPMIPGQEEHAIYEATEEAFQDHYDHTALPFEEWLQFRTADPERYDPSLWFLAWDGEEVAGVALCQPVTPESPDEGLVSVLGVRRPWRRRGLGMALLQHSFYELFRRGRRTVALFVDSASLTGATRLYERAGMRVVAQRDSYAKELRPGRE